MNISILKQIDQNHIINKIGGSKLYLTIFVTKSEFKILGYFNYLFLFKKSKHQDSLIST